MKNSTELMVTFCIFGNKFNPRDFTELIKITPTSSGIIGEIQPPFNSPVKESYWEFSSGYIQTRDFDDIYHSWLLPLKEKTTFIQLYAKEKELEMKIYIVIKIWNSETPSVVIREDLVTFANLCNAVIEFDIYSDSDSTPALSM